MALQHAFQKSLQLCQAVSPMLALGVPPITLNSTLARPKLCCLLLPPVSASFQQAAKAPTPASGLFNSRPSSAISVCGSTLNYQFAIIFLEPVKPVFFNLRHLRSIQKLLGRDIIIQLVCALVLSCLDFCNGVLRVFWLQCFRLSSGFTILPPCRK